MAVAFRELGGSPVEQYNTTGFSARREFLIAWEDRDAFAVDVLGDAAEHGGQISVSYPGKSLAKAIRVRYVPVDPEHPDDQELALLAEGLNSYSGSFAKAVVDYSTIIPQDRYDGPENELGTYLSYNMFRAVDHETVRPGGWQWTDNSQAIASDFELRKRIPVTEHHLTWHQVVNAPWAAIRQQQGTVNDAEFIGCPAGTILFDGAEANKVFRAGFEEGDSPFCWKINFIFRERSVKHGGGIFGWNHFYRESPAGWVEIDNGTDKLYDSSDLMLLFQSEEP